MSQICRTCGDTYPDAGDGWDGECPSCADRTFAAENPEDDTDVISDEQERADLYERAWRQVEDADTTTAALDNALDLLPTPQLRALVKRLES